MGRVNDSFGVSWRLRMRKPSGRPESAIVERFMTAAAFLSVLGSGLMAGLYLAGCTTVTIIFNVPLNNALPAMAADSRDGAAIWARYLAEWVPWNHLRTVACLASRASLIQALR
jgi:uncharacterized membrane protein